MKKDNLEAIYPLSPMQEGMLFHSLYAPHLEVYFEQFAYTLHGDLNIPAFKQAWQQVIAHHPILRTLFLWEDQEKPLQVVLRRVELPWKEHDWRDIPASRQPQLLQDWLQIDRTHDFDLSQAPVMRLNLIRLGEYTYHFTWSFHHLLLDGWSVYIVMDQVFSGYGALRQGRRFALPISRPFRDYIAWLQQQDLARVETFWRKTLRSFTAPTSLGIIQPHLRKAEPAGEYRDYRIHLSEATTTGLQQLARQHRLTLNTLVQGAWAILLSHYSGQDDVVFGATVSGRPPELAGVDTMVGLFINTLPMRAQIKPQLPLIPWLQELQAWQVEARQYEYSPLVQVQGWSDVPRGQPLFENLLIFDNYPADTSLVEDMSLQIERMQVIERTNYPLTISVVPMGRMMIRVSYAGTHFADESIRRLLEHLQTLLAGMVDNPHQQLADLPLLTEAERQQQPVALYEAFMRWNATAAPFPAAQTLPQLFEQQVARTPEAIAVVWEQDALSYLELDRRANQLAHVLQQRGAGPETLVGLCVQRSLALPVAVLGILKTGAAYLPLDPSYPAERLAFMLTDAQVPLLLTQRHLQGSVPTTEAQVLCLDAPGEEIAHASVEPLGTPLQAEQLAYVLYTSGSTGQPKGVMGTHCATLNRLHWMWEQFPFTRGEVCCQKTALSFVDSIWEIFGPLLRGVTTVILPDERVKDPHRLVATLAEQGITRIVLVPSLLSMLLETNLDFATYLSQVRYWVSSGEALSVETTERFLDRLPQSVLINLYGSSEVAADATCALITSGHGLTSIPIGRPIANIQSYLLDSWGQPVPIGVPGELYLGGEGLARGYLNRPDLTAERFVPDPFGTYPGRRLYKTGDRAQYGCDGTIFYLGRLDHQVKLRGMRVELGEIEATLAQHPSVSTAVVVLQESRPEEKRLIAYIVSRQQEQVVSTNEMETIPQTGENVPPAALQSFLRERLPAYMVPSIVMHIPALPLLPNGKVDRRKLSSPEWFARFVAEQEDQSQGLDISKEPRTPIEEQLAEIWLSLLQLPKVGIHQDFFQSGGHSLLAMRVITRVRTIFKVELPLQSFFVAPTIADMARAIEEQLGKQDDRHITVIQKAEPESDAGLLEKLEHLSDEEIEALFTTMVTEEEIEG